MEQEVKNWWSQAIEDLDSAEVNLKVKKFYISSFLSQQAVEKALKALYIKKFKKLIKIHNIVVLAQELDLPDKLINICDRLNPVYLEARYPDASGTLPVYEYSEEDSRKDLKDAKEVMEWIREKI